MTGELKCVYTQDSGVVTIMVAIDGRKGWARTHTGPHYRNHVRWQHFKIGDVVTGLRWKDEQRGIIDADSDVELL